MLIAVWSVKGGSGVSVVSALLALTCAQHSPVLLVDLVGDQPAVLGISEPDPDSPGVVDLLAVESAVAASARLRMERDVAPNLALLGAGGTNGDGVGALHDPEAVQHLLADLSTDGRRVIVDCGLVSATPTSAARAFASAAFTSILVMRPCYLALRRSARSPLVPDGVVVVNEPSRALGRDDIESVTGVPVIAVVEHDPAIARLVDAGLLAARLPGAASRALRGVV